MPPTLLNSIDLYSPIICLPGIGKQIMVTLARLNIFSIFDLLFHFPLRYQDRTQLQAIRQLIIDEEAVVEGVIRQVSSTKKTKLLCEIKDETGKMYLRFFHLLPFQTQILKVGTLVRCYGQVRSGPKGLEMFHPEFHVIQSHQSIPIESHLTPIYPATEGLSQYQLRKLISQALAYLDQGSVLAELLPQPLLNSATFPSFKESLHYIHRPPRDASRDQLADYQSKAQQRLIFEELLAHRLSLLRLKQLFQAQASQSFKLQKHYVELFYQHLPFTLTKAQQRVINEIQQDLAKSQPMLRLLQGDVGSGKTVVAAFAMLQAIENGFQAALMAPTELLAEQHYRVFKRWLEPLGLSVAFLSGSIKGKARHNVLHAIAEGQAQVILGTHALFQAEVNFANLGLIIIDEQHRFGVHQRALFREKARQQDFFPHQLIMTATPIPRTLAMSFYADLDCSVIDELPPGRTPITTSVLANTRREEVIERIRTACQQGKQVYWVCPLIEESEVLACQAATEIAALLQQILSELTIGLIHGRQKAEAKDQTMQAFQQGSIHVLVATTVIEVGVDVPNASVMVIENAERLGLSQLHQLRGRVGRGSIASHCILLYQHPLSPLAIARLTVMRETTDGFKIAQKDLELRGPGEVFGTKQTGELGFRIADLLRDNLLLPEVQTTAQLLLNTYPQIIEPLITRWVGQGQEYGKV